MLIVRTETKGRERETCNPVNRCQWKSSNCQLPWFQIAYIDLGPGMYWISQYIWTCFWIIIKRIQRDIWIFWDEIEIFVSLNLVVRDEIENIFFQLSSFETKRDFCLINLGVRDENEIFSFKISCFEKGTRITKWNLMVEREKMKLILARIPGIENSRWSLVCIMFGVKDAILLLAMALRYFLNLL